MKQYKNIDKIPTGTARDKITDGCLVLEGGGWRGLYTLGVIDYLMQNDINLSSVVGCSAGSLAALQYITGQIGWGAHIDLKYRHDKNYCGRKAFKTDKGITGFSYLFNEIQKDIPLDIDKLNNSKRKLAVSATNILTGKTEYFEKGKCDILKAAQASSTVPYVSKPVIINKIPYLDGGCVEKIPYNWAKNNKYKKIVIVRTRELEFRRKEGLPAVAKILYKKYPNLVKNMEKTNKKFNDMVEMLEKKHKDKEVFVIAPSKKVTVSRFEGNMDKLGDLYWLGYNDAKNSLKDLKEYLNL